jgi:AGZA family xanthine/uracil permease-like MFS transporter
MAAASGGLLFINGLGSISGPFVIGWLMTRLGANGYFLFLAALFVGPLVKMIASYPPITAPALVLVGTMMMRNAKKIAWDDPSEALPVFLTVAGIPLTASIADGLALGFVSYPVVKLLGGRARDVHWLSYVIAGLLVAYFLLVRSRLG